MKKIQNIVFIDDDEITCYLNRIVLEEMGVTENIICLEDEHEALEYIKNKCSNRRAGEDQCPEIIFLDLNMPFFNGFEFLEQLERDADIDTDLLYIVLLTSSWHAGDMEKAKHYPVKDFLNKPLTVEKVQDIVISYHAQLNSIPASAY